MRRGRSAQRRPAQEGDGERESSGSTRGRRGRGSSPGMNMAPRSSKWLLSRLYRAKNTGSCRSSGRQPESGFTFSFLYSSAISWFILSGLSFSRARISAILGFSAAILAMDSELLKVSGQEDDLGEQREQDDGDAVVGDEQVEEVQDVLHQVGQPPDEDGRGDHLVRVQARDAERVLRRVVVARRGSPSSSAPCRSGRCRCVFALFSAGRSKEMAERSKPSTSLRES